MSKQEIPYMSTAEIRSSFLKFFEDKGCKLFASSSLIPDDPSLLLANAGMNQFKQYYLGTKTMAEIGATSCQKCLRTNDIDAIGLDGRHLSFFEMLGNFSFGGYTKRQACEWAFDYITNYLHLPVEQLYFTVFTDDDEAAEIWHSLGVEKDHISRLGEDDNFWSAGPTGPCGPCSEIYFDQGEDVGCGCEDCKPGCDCDRFLEFWNLVFTQYDRQEDGTLVDLPHQNIDTGMGLERISAIVQGKSSNYDGDVMQGLIKVGERLSGKKFGEDTAADVSLRIIADHSRAVTFMIADGILPSNEGRGYVLRRLLRRAVFHGRMLGITDAFLNDYVAEVTKTMGLAYPELVENAALVESTVRAEEARFSATLETGRTYLMAALSDLEEGQVLPGDIAFTLHDTYGFPIDLTQEIAGANGHETDMDTFRANMEAQRDRARKASATDADAWSNVDVWTSLSDEHDATCFEGYELDVVDNAEVISIVTGGESVLSANAGAKVEVVLDHTPFYAEMGGQSGDTGVIAGENFTIRVNDTKTHDGLVAHVGEVVEGTVSVADLAKATIDVQRRNLIRRNHTATHLLDAALKMVLGDHVHQAGSLVAPTHLRFDFTHFEAVTKMQLEEIERIVNEQIFAAIPVVTHVMGIDEAKEAGAIALFGEKYGDVVRVVSTGDDISGAFSAELCGGTHAHNTAEIGMFKITSESSVGAAVRRIEAVTSAGALQYVNERLEALDAASAALKCRPMEVAGRVEDGLKKERELKQRLQQAMTGGASNAVAKAISGVFDVNGYKCIVAGFADMEAKELRTVWDTIRDKVPAPVACVIGSKTPEGKVALLAAASKDAVEAGFNANAVIKDIAGFVGGRGGGKPDMAQAGGKDSAGLDQALETARNLLS